MKECLCYLQRYYYPTITPTAVLLLLCLTAITPDDILCRTRWNCVRINAIATPSTTTLRNANGSHGWVVCRDLIPLLGAHVNPIVMLVNLWHGTHGGGAYFVLYASTRRSKPYYSEGQSY